MNNDIKQNKLRRNVSIFLVLFSIAVYAIVGILVIISRNAESEQQTDDKMLTAVNNLRDRLIIENKTSCDKASESLRLFIQFLRQGGQITEEKDSVSRQVTDFVTGETFYRKVPRWTIRGRDFSAVMSAHSVSYARDAAAQNQRILITLAYTAYIGSAFNRKSGHRTFLCGRFCTDG